MRVKDHQKLIEKLSEVSTILRISQQLDIPTKDLTIEIIEEIGDVQGKLDSIKKHYINQLSSPSSPSSEQPITHQSPTYESPVEPTILPKKVPKVVESPLPEKPKEQKEPKDQDTFNLGEKFSLLNDELETKTDSNKKFFLKELEEVKKSNINIEEEIKSLKEPKDQDTFNLGEKFSLLNDELETKTDSNKKFFLKELEEVKKSNINIKEEIKSLKEHLGEKITYVLHELETKTDSNKKLITEELEKVKELKETNKKLQTFLNLQETYSERHQQLLTNEFNKFKSDGVYKEFISKEFKKLKEDLNNDLKDIVESVKNIKVF
tara:strand:+ start:69 stop:1031 length:963 start_codon:yes stop_codon:yes gene_type:complete